MTVRVLDAEILLNLRETADFLRASRAKLYRLVRNGDLPARKVGATYVFYKRDLIAYVDRDLRGSGIARTAAERLGPQGGAKSLASQSHV